MCFEHMSNSPNRCKANTHTQPHSAVSRPDYFIFLNTVIKLSNPHTYFYEWTFRNVLWNWFLHLIKSNNRLLWELHKSTVSLDSQQQHFTWHSNSLSSKQGRINGDFPQLQVTCPSNKSFFLLVGTSGLAVLYPVSLLRLLYKQTFLSQRMHPCISPESSIFITKPRCLNVQVINV